jgi:hypothetical protein
MLAGIRTWIQDNLAPALNILMLLHPMDAVSQ